MLLSCACTGHGASKITIRTRIRAITIVKFFLLISSSWSLEEVYITTSCYLQLVIYSFRYHEWRVGLEADCGWITGQSALSIKRSKCLATNGVCSSSATSFSRTEGIFA